MQPSHPHKQSEFSRQLNNNVGNYFLKVRKAHSRRRTMFQRVNAANGSAEREDSASPQHSSRKKHQPPATIEEGHIEGGEAFSYSKNQASTSRYRAISMSPNVRKGGKMTGSTRRGLMYERKS